MKSITININDEIKTLLENEVNESNTSMDELINSVLEAHFKEKQKRFEEARKYVRGRYKELYKRLA